MITTPWRTLGFVFYSFEGSRQRELVQVQRRDGDDDSGSSLLLYVCRSLGYSRCDLRDYMHASKILYSTSLGPRVSPAKHEMSIASEDSLPVVSILEYSFSIVSTLIANGDIDSHCQLYISRLNANSFATHCPSARAHSGKLERLHGCFSFSPFPFFMPRH